MKFGKLGVGAAVVVATVGFALYKRSQPVAVEVVQLKRQDITTTLAVTGRLEAVNRTSVASTAGSARVQKVLVDVGDRVLAGQTLIVLDTRDLQDAVAIARADLASAKADLLKAKAQTEGSKQGSMLAELVLRDRTALVSERDRFKAQVRTLIERKSQASAALERTKAGARTETVSAAEAQVAADQSAAILKESELKRARKLFDEGVYSQAQLDQAQAAKDQASAKFSASISQVEALKSGRKEDVREAEAAVKEVDASLEGAKANLQTAELALTNRTSERQAAESSKAQLKANLALEEAGHSQIEAAEARLKQAESRLSQSSIIAPFDGIVTARKIEPGQVAAAGVTLIELSTPGSLRVRLDVDETYLGEVFLGQEAAVTASALGSEQIKGKVTEISSAADPARGTVEVRVSLDQRNPKLVSQMTVDVNLIVAKRKNALVVPRQSVPKAESDPKAVVIENGKAVVRKIKVVKGDETHWVVLEGLNEGEAVVVDPSQLPKGKELKPKVVEEPKE